MDWSDNTRIEEIPLKSLIKLNTVNISEYTQFHLYEICWYLVPASGVDKGEKLGRIGEISNDVGQAM